MPADLPPRVQQIHAEAIEAGEAPVDLIIADYRLGRWGLRAWTQSRLFAPISAARSLPLS